jgi:hypothetical protein
MEKSEWLAEYRLVIPRQKTLKRHYQRVAAFTGISGWFKTKPVSSKNQVTH